MKTLLLAAGIGLLVANAASAAPLGTVKRPMVSEAQGVQLVRQGARHRRVVRPRVHVVRRAGYPGGYVAAPAPYYAVPGYVAPGPSYGDRGDPLHRYYTPGLAPNVRNPSVSPSYQNPAVDDGLIFPRE